MTATNLAGAPLQVPDLSRRMAALNRSELTVSYINLDVIYSLDNSI